jgi:hypothetical protein
MLAKQLLSGSQGQGTQHKPLFLAGISHRRFDSVVGEDTAIFVLENLDRLLVQLNGGLHITVSQHFARTQQHSSGLDHKQHTHTPNYTNWKEQC